MLFQRILSDGSLTTLRIDIMIIIRITEKGKKKENKKLWLKEFHHWALQYGKPLFWADSVQYSFSPSNMSCYYESQMEHMREKMHHYDFCFYNSSLSPALSGFPSNYTRYFTYAHSLTASSSLYTSSRKELLFSLAEWALINLN